MGTKTHRARAGRAHSEDEEAVEQVGVEVEGSAARPLPVAETVLDESGFVEFAVTGTQISGEFRCTECGYGAVVYRELPPCPMCGGTVWESRGSSAQRPLD
jgi:rubrerythrin